MKMKDLAQRLEVIDTQLAQRKVQVTVRPFEAHRLIMAEDRIKTLPLFSRGNPPTLFEQINDWYMNRYGERMLMDMKIGEMPFLLRGLVYYLKFPLSYGTVQLDVLKCVEGLTDDMRCSLTRDEMQYIGQIFMEGCYQCGKLDTLRQYPPSALSSEAQQMCKRGLQDINAAISIFKGSHDVQCVMFHAQQAAEKFLKAALLQNGYTVRQLRSRDFSHDLQAGLTALIGKSDIYRHIARAVADVDISMNIRYQELGHCDIDAVRCIYAALHISSFIANQWWLDEMRKGQPPALVPGKFYQNGMGINYKCVDVKTDPVKGDIAILAMLDHGGFDAVMTQNTQFAFYYYEITDPKEIARLDQRYERVILRKGKVA